MIATVLGAFKDVFLYADLIAHFWVNWDGNVTKRSLRIPSYWMPQTQQQIISRPFLLLFKATRNAYWFRDERYLWRRSKITTI